VRDDKGAYDELMIETLEEGLRQLSGERVRVRSIRDKEFTRSTSFAIHRIDVELQSGDILPCVFKDLNPLRQLPDAKQVRRLELGRSRREVWMYRQILPRLSLGTPQLYGYRWEPKQGNLWLFIEDAGRHRHGHRLDLAWYEQAAAWAGRFHRATAGSPGDERLLRFDRAHYERQGKDLEAVLERTGEDQPIVERALARYGELVQSVDNLPRGMIHGEFFGKNVLIRPDQATDTIAVIDWETAATGPQYVDLVSISAGRWTTSQRMAMRRSYFAARYPTAADDADWNRFNQETDMVAILEAVSWLGYWAGSGPANDAKHLSRVSRWLRELRLAMGEEGAY